MVEVRELVIAGWTGRDEAALRKHIRELEEIGVKPPKTTPIFYRVSANLFCFSTEIQVSGPDTSGEVEFVLIRTNDDLFVAAGSDHTDRKAETIGVSLSKQLCAKPVSRESWRYDEVKPHWERLGLTVSCTRKGPWRRCARPKTSWAAIRSRRAMPCSAARSLRRGASVRQSASGWSSKTRCASASSPTSTP